MHRIDSPNARANANGAGKAGYHLNTDLSGVEPTHLDPAALNALQEELCSVIETAAIALVKGTNNQLLTALQTLFAAKVGNAGQVFNVATATGDTHAATFKQLVDGLATKAANNGSDTESFRAKDGATDKEVVNFGQLTAAEVRILNRAYPIGTVYENEVDMRNPNHPDLLGFGTWIPTQEGLVSIGYHLGDLDFGTLNQVGGNRAIDMSLTVGLTAGTGLYVIDDVVTTPSMGVFSDFINSGDAADANDIALRFKLDASGSSNLPPYTVSKKWRRTA